MAAGRLAGAGALHRWGREEPGQEASVPEDGRPAKALGRTVLRSVSVGVCWGGREDLHRRGQTAADATGRPLHDTRALQLATALPVPVTSLP